MRRADRLAAGLLALGLYKGDRIGIWSPNKPAWLIAQFATARIGLILVNINPAYRRHELDYTLNKVEAKALITARQFKSSDYIAMLTDLAPELDKATPGRLKAKRLPHLTTVIQIGDEPIAGMFSFDEVMNKGGGGNRARLDAISSSLDRNDPINIQFTSGTTGAPKGATLTHSNIVNNGRYCAYAMDLGPHDRLAIPVPFYHCFGMVLGNLAAVAAGATMVFPGEAFDPLDCLNALADERCTGVHGVPTMFGAMIDHPRFSEFDLKTLRTGIMAGSPCPIELMKRVVSQMHVNEITIAYGMTETSPVSFQSDTKDNLERRVSTVGRIHPHVEVKIVDAEGKTSPVGEKGELLTRGYSVMQGYWDDPERSVRIHRRRGVDAHRRSRHHRRARLLQHRRPGEGHADPRRRERLSARGRGIPVHPSQNTAGAGVRGARSQIRRGGRGVDHPQARPVIERGRDPRLLPGPDRPLQDPALCALRRRIADDRHRQGTEIRDARQDGGRTGTCRG